MERADYETQRENHVDRIREGLEEAAKLMSTLNRNLEAWGETTRETEKVSEVWMQFQCRLALLSEAFAGVYSVTPVWGVILNRKLFAVDWIRQRCAGAGMGLDHCTGQ